MSLNEAPQQSSPTESSTETGRKRMNGRTGITPLKFLVGAEVLINNLKNRTDLNGMNGTVKRKLKNGRVAVEVRIGNKNDIKDTTDTKAPNTELVSLSPNNLSPFFLSLAQPIETRPECSVCMLPLPLAIDGSTYKSCCGKMLCNGCHIEIIKDRVVPTSSIENDGSPISEQTEFELISLAPMSAASCPFCRSGASRDFAHLLERTRIRIDKYNDTTAMICLGTWYDTGDCGLQENHQKAEELYKKAYDLGNPDAAYKLAGGRALINNNDCNDIKMMEYLEEAVRRGCIDAEYQMAFFAHKSNNLQKMTNHLMKAARAGQDDAMEQLLQCCRDGIISKDDIESTVRDYQSAVDGVKSESREYAKRFVRWQSEI